MKVHIKGKGEVDLNKNDFIAQGGEGSIYAKQGYAFKIYNDANKMLPLGKIQELSVLTHPSIIKPEDVLVDGKGKAIGYTMKYVKDTYALCQIFTKAFRQRENITPAKMLELVKKLQNVVKHVHDKGLLIVDLNEMNFLCSDGFDDIFAIDVDSYQTPSFHATALMESIRDRHSPNKFDQGTDWFAFGIVSFQMFIGIHPYKGKHPTLKTMDERMLKNISVLNNDVSIPSVCYDFSVIPKNYLDWYKAVFENGKRMVPPFDGQLAAVIQKIVKIKGSNNFTIQEVFDFGDELTMFIANGAELAVTKTETFLNRKKMNNVNANSVVCVTPKMNYVVTAWKENNKLKMFNVNTQKPIVLDIDCNALMCVDGRLYCQNGGNVIEVKFAEVGQNVIATPRVSGTVLPNAAKFYQGVVIQNLMGAQYASLFPKTDTCFQVHLKELDQHKIVDAKCENNVLMVIAVKAGQYDKFVFRFNELLNQYDVTVHKDVTVHDINFVVLDNGICIHIHDENELEIFSSKMNSQTRKVINDKDISTDMKLKKIGNQVYFTEASKLYSFKMK